MNDPSSQRRLFQRWLNKAAQVTSLHMSTEERRHNLEQKKCAPCEKWKAGCLTTVCAVPS